MRNPIQPLVKDGQGVLRFKPNEIVWHLLSWARERGHNLNDIAAMEFSNDDRQQFAQLIGYSLSGFAELPEVDDDVYRAAVKMSEGITEEQARIESLQGELDILRDALREPMARLFGINSDDLERD